MPTNEPRNADLNIEKILEWGSAVSFQRWSRRWLDSEVTNATIRLRWS
jgi:hypothetical protein